MKKSIELYQVFKEHLNDIISGYEESHLEASYDKKVKELIRIFKVEHGSGKMIAYHRGVENSFITWLNGLPNCIYTLYTYYDIENFWKGISLELWNTIKDMDYSKLYHTYIYETINNEYDILSYIFNSLELENTKRKEVL